MRIALVGAGGMGTCHYMNYRHIEGAQVVALVGRGERDRAHAEQWGLPLYTCVDEPTYLHKAIVLEALACKKPVICEKPIALHVKDAQEMFDAAQANGVQLYVAQVLQFTREVEQLHRIVDERVEALEFLASPSTRHLGETLLQITLKPDILIACINRKGRIIIPKGDDTIEPGDTLIVVTTADRMIVDLNDIFADAPERLAAVQ